MVVVTAGGRALTDCSPWGGTPGAGDDVKGFEVVVLEVELYIIEQRSVDPYTCPYTVMNGLAHLAVVVLLLEEVVGVAEGAEGAEVVAGSQGLGRGAVLGVP